jgi:hypothetical protein
VILGYRREAAFLVLAMMADIANFFLKYAFHRTRLIHTSNKVLTLFR